MTDSEKAKWDQFHYTQWKRVPDVMDKVPALNNFEDEVEEQLRELEAAGHSITDAERENLRNAKTLGRLKHNVSVEAYAAPGHEVRDVLAQRGLGIAIISAANKSFVIGSNPIVKLTEPGRTHLGDPSTEAWFPIASDVAVTPAGSLGEEVLKQVDDERHIRSINSEIFKQSTLIAGRSRSLIASLANAR